MPEAADARLIAAAPELLAEHISDLVSLERIRLGLTSGMHKDQQFALQYLDDMVKAKVAVIAKAEGVEPGRA